MAEPFFNAPDFWISLAALLVASAVVMGSPGPSTVSATAAAAAFGFRRSLAYGVGLISGTMAVLLAVASGLAAALASQPRIASALTIASAAYILYLAFAIATAPPLSKQGGEVASPSFVGGFLLAIANPKAYIAIAAVFAGATLAPDAPALDAALKLIALGAMIILIHLAWLAAGASLSRWLRDPLLSRLVNVSFAALLVAATIFPFMR